MADNRTPSPANYGDPFADRPRAHFQDPPSGNPTLRPYQSTTTLSGGAQDTYEDDDFVEKQPLNVGQNFSGGFYPPGYVFILVATVFPSTSQQLMGSPLDPNTLGDPYSRGRPDSVLSTATNGVESAWRRRQTIKRGVTRKVKLTQGNFIAEYPVPTPVLSAIEPRWAGTKTTEFS